MKSSKILELRFLTLWLVSALLGATVMHAAEGAIQLVPVLQGLSSPVYVTNAHDGTQPIVRHRAGWAHQGSCLRRERAESVSRHHVQSAIRRRARTAGARFSSAIREQFPILRQLHAPDGRCHGHCRVSRIDGPHRNRGEREHSSCHSAAVCQPQRRDDRVRGSTAISISEWATAAPPMTHRIVLRTSMNCWGRFFASTLTIPLAAMPYSSPPGNPFVGATPGRDEIFAVGMRNPFRFSFDRGTGQLYVGDVGQSALEEVDIVTAGGNYGWRVYEGTQCTGLDPRTLHADEFCRADRAIRSHGRALFHYRRLCLPRLGRSAAGGHVRIRRLLHGRNFLAGRRRDQFVARYVIEYFVFRGRRGGRNLCRGARWNRSSHPARSDRHNDDADDFRQSSGGGRQRDLYGDGDREQSHRQCQLSPMAARRSRVAPPLPLSGSGNSRTAMCSTSSLSAGTHSIVAAYGGDVANLPSSSTALSQVDEHR